MFIWMILSTVKILKKTKRTKVSTTKTIKTLDADLDITVATTFCSAGKVGIGRGVGVVGGGPIGFKVN